MTSAFTDKYSKAQSSLAKLSPLLISINDEITTLVSAQSSDDIEKSTAILGKNILDAHSIYYDYSEIFAHIERAVASMEDEGKKALEEKTLKDTIRSTDGSTQMDMDPVSVASIISNMEKKYGYSLELATKYVVAMNQLKASHTSTSANQSASISPPHSNLQSPSPSIPASASSVASPDNTSSLNNDCIAALTERINSLESSRSTLAPIHQPNIALPPIKLETFDGADITRWPAFKYQLDMLILNQPHLNEVEKAFYVRSSLKGTAYNLVATIPTQKNFLSKIIERLEQEYNRVHLTQAALMKSLRSIRAKSTKLGDQLTAVRSLINIVHTIDEDCGINGLCTQAQIAERIHTRFVPFVWRQRADTLLDALKLIEDTLRTELEDVTMIDAFSDRSTLKENPDPPFNNHRPTPNQSTPLTEVSPHQPSKSSKDLTCVFCGKHDYSGDCTAISSVKDRKDILRDKSLCHSCFSSYHSTTDCKKKCPLCSGKHHKSLCEKPPSLSSNTQTSLHSSQPTERLFTTYAMVSNPIISVGSPGYAPIHLDHGSQVTLISRKLANKLALVPFDRREMTICGINDKPSLPSMYDIVKFDMYTDAKKRSIEAVVRDVPSINTIHSQSLPDEDIDVIRSTLGKVPNRFSEPTAFHTDILLGVGHTLALLENAKDTKLPSGYRLIQSIIGPIVAGSPQISPEHTKEAPKPTPYPVGPPEDSSAITHCNFTSSLIHSVHSSTHAPPHPDAIPSNVHSPPNRLHPDPTFSNHDNRVTRIPSSSSPDHPSIRRRPRPSPSSHRHRSHSRSTHVSGTPSFHSKNTPNCVMCKSSLHLSKDCHVVTSISTRLDIIRREGRCGRCFRVLDSSHLLSCVPPPCFRGCKNSKKEPDRHCDYFCPPQPGSYPLTCSPSCSL